MIHADTPAPLLLYCLIGQTMTQHAHQLNSMINGCITPQRSSCGARDNAPVAMPAATLTLRSPPMRLCSWSGHDRAYAMHNRACCAAVYAWLNSIPGYERSGTAFYPIFARENPARPHTFVVSFFESQRWHGRSRHQTCITGPAPRYISATRMLLLAGIARAPAHR